MKRTIVIVSIFAAFLIAASSTFAQKDKAKYVPKYEDPTLKKIGEKADREQAVEDSITAAIRENQKKEKEALDKEKKQRETLRFDFKNVVKPASPEAFKSVFHFPPVAQYRTGTCWCFSTTSFFESEIYRLHGKKIKLSEMYTVYNERVEKARRFIRERGNSPVDEGSEANAVARMMKLYGAVPAEAYSGWVKDGLYDHEVMVKRIADYLNFVKQSNYWDEEKILNVVRSILEEYMGTPPKTFVYEGKTLTPKEFVSDVIKINPDDYVDVMSTISVPFYTFAEYEFPDNWWHDKSYYNVPLDDWYGVIKNAINKGYSLAIGGDVTEPGYNGFEDAAVVADFDIPTAYVNQDSREYRIYNKSTQDDHGVHLVGYTKVGNYDWFLIKDSARSARWGKFEGYYFYRGDYIRLKTLTIIVHKDMVQDILKKEVKK